MKKNKNLFLLIFLIAGKVAAQDSTAKKGWPAIERANFITSCINSAKVNLGEDSARLYCYCMQEKVENKYPSIEDAAKLTAEDMSSPEWKKEIQDCLTITSTWTSVDRSSFLTSCISTAKSGLGEQKAKSYCECMLFKMEIKFPLIADFTKITKETMQTPEFKKMANDCLGF